MAFSIKKTYMKLKNKLTLGITFLFVLIVSFGSL